MKVRHRTNGFRGARWRAASAVIETGIVLALIVSLLAGCGSGSPATGSPTAPHPTATQTPPPPAATHTPTETATPVPTATPPPTATPQPTSTHTPTHTPAPFATATPAPAMAPRPTATAGPTATPWDAPDTAEGHTITVCAAGCDHATIQAALDDAGTVGGDTIYVADAVHTEQGIDVHKDVVIQGRGAGYTVVQAHERAGKATDRVFHIVEGATATLRALAIRHGNPTEGVRSGGAILNHGTLTVEDSLLYDNRANCGAGILNVRATLTMRNSTVRDNVAHGEGPSGYECGSGAAIKLEDKSVATLERCTLSDNQGKGKGGALHVSCTSKATVTNCTISGNQAEGLGGGISAKGDLTLIHCTINGNSARGVVRGKAIGTQAGGGIAIRGAASLTMIGTLIANNPRDGDCMLGEQVTVVANEHNWIEDGSCDAAYSGDPALERLSDNGGDTRTHALLPGSPAIDAIPADACALDRDQRGMPRPAGEACDVGAFEAGDP